MITAAVKESLPTVCAFPVLSQELSEGLVRGKAEISRDVKKEEGNGIHVLRKQNGNYLQGGRESARGGTGKGLTVEQMSAENDTPG